MEYKPTFTISDTQLLKITDYLGYQTKIDGKENPQIRPLFLLSKVKDHLKNCYLAEKSKEGEVARLLALEEGKIDLETLDVS